MSINVLITTIIIILLGVGGKLCGQTPEVIKSTKIWDQANHNAFTDLVYFQGRFYCTFREGTGHVPGDTGKDGGIRVIKSVDGKEWKSVALLEVDQYDLRDPKLSITPDNRLMLLMGSTDYDGKIMKARVPRVSFSSDGTKFSEPIPVKIDSKISNQLDWLWRVTWHKNTGYGVVYQDMGNTSSASLVKTTNGIEYQLVTKLNIDGKPNEATIKITADDEMTMIIRRESENRHGFLGKSKPPYVKWTWQDMGIRLGGPDFIPLTNENLLLGTRVYSEQGSKTGLFIIDEKGESKQVAEFPSGGDTSYPGMVSLNETLYISYYASHEHKTSIYFATIPLTKVHAWETARQPRQ